ncbi:MAG: molybdopterin-dependent oxidoreductase [Candidatus Bathyarchaeia archaeon]
MSNPEVRRGWCGPCHTRCGLLVYFEGGKAVKVVGDPRHPVNRGAICSRGRLILEHLYHPDRVNFPLKKIGERGRGKWERISWSEALDGIAAKIKEIKAKFGAESIVFCGGTYRTYSWASKRFFNLLGSPNTTGPGAICHCPSVSIESATYGSMAHSDIRNAACIVLWGHSPSESVPIPEWNEIVAAKNRGAKLIVVDPRLTREAKMADLWLQIRPGTDAALMLSWIKIIIDEGLYDREFVEKWTVGFGKLKEHVAAYSVEKVSEVTWIPEDKILEGARMYATIKPAALTWGLGCDKQGVNLSNAVRARSILRAITGNLDVKGGDIIGFSKPLGDVVSDVEMELNEMLPTEQRRKQLGSDKYRLFSFQGWELINDAIRKASQTYVKPPSAQMTAQANPRAIWEAVMDGKPYPVKAMIVVGGNPLMSLANTKLVYHALKHLELLVVMEYYMTPTAELADYVLPAASTLERDDVAIAGPRVFACPKALEPLYERRSDYEFWRGLGLRLDQEEYWPWKTAEEMCDYRLKPLDITFKELVEKYEIFAPPEYRKYEKYGFATMSAKVEIYSHIFEKLGYDPLPSYIEPPETPVSAPDIAKDYPLILNTGGRFLPMYHSELRQIRSAREAFPEPIVDIHPETAKKLNVKNGDWVWIQTLRGRIKQKARLNEEVHLQMVHVQHGWWFPEKTGEDPDLHGLWDSNVNIICPDDPEYCSKEIGGWPLTALLCKIYKTEG